MVNLPNVVNRDTYTISDTHMGHARVLQFEPIRIKFLLEFNPSVIDKCNDLLDLLNIIPQEDHRSNVTINNMCHYLIPFHDEMITTKWNNVVGKDDTVLHLGDFAFRNIEENSDNLNGNKILIRGNHDRKSSKHYINCGWKDVIDTVKLNINGNTFEMITPLEKNWNGYLTKIDNIKILFSHYPIKNSNDWDTKKYGQLTQMLAEVYDGYEANTNIHGHVHSLTSAFKNAINVSVEHINLTPIKVKTLLLNNEYIKK